MEGAETAEGMGGDLRRVLPTAALWAAAGEEPADGEQEAIARATYSGGGAGEGLKGTTDTLWLSLELKPADCSVPLRLAAHLGALRLQLLPHMIAALLQFFDLPQSQWQAAAEIERELEQGDTAHVLEESLDITLRIDSPEILYVGEEAQGWWSTDMRLGQSAGSVGAAAATADADNVGVVRALLVSIGDVCADFSPSSPCAEGFGAPAYLPLSIQLRGLRAVAIQMKHRRTAEWLLQGGDASPRPRPASSVVGSFKRLHFAPQLSELQGSSVSSETPLPLTVAVESVLVHPLAVQVSVSLRMSVPAHFEPLLRVDARLPALRCSASEVDLYLVCRLAERVKDVLTAIELPPPRPSPRAALWLGARRGETTLRNLERQNQLAVHAAVGSVVLEVFSSGSAQSGAEVGAEEAASHAARAQGNAPPLLLLRASSIDATLQGRLHRLAIAARIGELSVYGASPSSPGAFCADPVSGRPDVLPILALTPGDASTAPGGADSGISASLEIFEPESIDFSSAEAQLSLRLTLGNLECNFFASWLFEVLRWLARPMSALSPFMHLEEQELPILNRPLLVFEATSEMITLTAYPVVNDRSDPVPLLSARVNSTRTKLVLETDEAVPPLPPLPPFPPLLCLSTSVERLEVWQGPTTLISADLSRDATDSATAASPLAASQLIQFQLRVLGSEEAHTLGYALDISVAVLPLLARIPLLQLHQVHCWL